MPIYEVGPEHPLSYRKEVLGKLFGHVRGADSFYVLGAASMGKTRLMDFMMRPDVQRHYLGEQYPETWIVRVDMNRLPVRKGWYFFELLLSSLLLACNEHEKSDDFRKMLGALDSRVIESRDFLRALRSFEMGVGQLCQTYEMKLCFLFDEFDETYQSMPKKLFAQLRSVRDANKNRLCYGMFLRNLPERLRPAIDNESFYELLSRNAIGVGPYTKDDAYRMIEQLESRLEFPLTTQKREWLYRHSGGHPGLIRALLDILISDPDAARSNIMADLPRTIKHENVQEECRKVWFGLLEEEQVALKQVVQNPTAEIAPDLLKLLLSKGLLQSSGDRKWAFSILFEQYVKIQAGA
jgi:hypothetical protein